MAKAVAGTVRGHLRRLRGRYRLQHGLSRGCARSSTELLVRLDAGARACPVPGRSRRHAWAAAASSSGCVGSSIGPATAAELPWLVHQRACRRLVAGRRRHSCAGARGRYRLFAWACGFRSPAPTTSHSCGRRTSRRRRTAPTSATIACASSRRPAARGRKQVSRPTTANPCRRRSRRCSCRATWMRQRRFRSPEHVAPGFPESRRGHLARPGPHGMERLRRPPLPAIRRVWTRPAVSIPRARRSRGRRSRSRRPA